MIEQEKDCGCPEGKVRDAEGRCVMPKISFSDFIMSLSTTALFHLGEMAHPETGKPQKNLPLAQHTIDTLTLLEKKTKGNLTTEETGLLSNILYDLKLRFVKVKS